MERWRVVVAVLVLTAFGTAVLSMPAKAAGKRQAPPAGRTGRPPSTAAWVSSRHGPADPELQKGLTAYGQGRYAEARRIAEELLTRRNRGSTHAEAVDMLVESWLAEGNFTQARAAAQKHRAQAPKESRQALARINGQEKSYAAELKQHQAREAKATKPEAKAQAHLMMGHVHHQYGRLDLAEKTYQEVLVKYPKTKAASRAQRQLDSLHGKPRHALNPKPAKQPKSKLAKAAPKAKAKPVS